MKSIVRFCLAATLAAAASAHAYPQAMGQADYGSSAAGSTFARRIDLGHVDKWINVKEDETVELVNAAGESFAWKFDTAANVVPLAAIVPPSFLQGHAIDAYVAHLPVSD